METLKKEESNEEGIEALKRALIGIKSLREEAFILLTAVPKDYLPEIVEYLQILNGLRKYDS